MICRGFMQDGARNKENNNQVDELVVLAGKMQIRSTKIDDKPKDRVIAPLSFGKRKREYSEQKVDPQNSLRQIKRMGGNPDNKDEEKIVMERLQENEEPMLKWFASTLSEKSFEELADILMEHIGNKESSPIIIKATLIALKDKSASCDTFLKVMQEALERARFKECADIVGLILNVGMSNVFSQDATKPCLASDHNNASLIFSSAMLPGEEEQVFNTPSPFPSSMSQEEEEEEQAYYGLSRK